MAQEKTGMKRDSGEGSKMQSLSTVCTRIVTNWGAIRRGKLGECEHQGVIGRLVSQSNVSDSVYLSCANMADGCSR